MHPCCWDILQQQYALLASPTKMHLDLNELSKIFTQIPLAKSSTGGFRPDWAIDSAGTEQLLVFDYSDDMSEAQKHPHFLLCDPGTACGFDELLANPPLEPAGNTSPRINFPQNGGDGFSRLPVEILTEILVLLPSASVRDLPLASRAMASVGFCSRYWRSRFEFPNDLCHVRLPPALLESGQVDGKPVDWRRLCDQLLHPVGDQYQWWQNRKRMTALNRALVKSMSRRDSDGRLKGVKDIPIV